MNYYIDDNMFNEFVKNHNELVKTTGRKMIKTADFIEERSWIDNPWETKDLIADVINNHFAGDEYGFEDFYEKAEQTDKITKEGNKYLIWVGKEKVELPKEVAEKVFLGEDNDDL